MIPKNGFYFRITCGRFGGLIGRCVEIYEGMAVLHILHQECSILAYEKLGNLKRILRWEFVSGHILELK